MVFLLHHWDSAGRTGDIFSSALTETPTVPLTGAAHPSRHNQGPSASAAHLEQGAGPQRVYKNPAEAEGPIHFSSLLLAVCSAATVTKMSDVDGRRTGC